MLPECCSGYLCHAAARPASHLADITTLHMSAQADGKAQEALSHSAASVLRLTAGAAEFYCLADPFPPGALPTFGTYYYSAVQLQRNGQAVKPCQHEDSSRQA